MDDLISRQLVIKTLCERRCGNKSKGCPSGFCTESLAVDCIPSAQPYTEAEIQKMQDLEQAEMLKAYECGRASAQPEIIRCKDCRKHNVHSGYKDDCCPLYEWRGMSYGHEHDYQYCSFAGRREE